MKVPLTGVILAGGQNSRFSGRNKAFIEIGGEKIVDRIFDLFKDLFEETILVTNDPLQYVAYDCMIVTDIFPFRSSLTGLHTGLFYATMPHTFFSACDTPFLKREVIHMLIDAVDAATDIIVPETAAGLEPLCAVYSKKCLQPIEHQLSLNELKIQRFFKKVRVKKIPETALMEKDPDLISFFNVNTPQDVVEAEAFENRQAIVR